MPLKQSIIFPEEVTEQDWRRIKSAAALDGQTVGEFVWKALQHYGKFRAAEGIPPVKVKK